MKLVKFVKFKEVSKHFPHPKGITIEKLIQNIPTKCILLISSHITARLHNNFWDQTQHRELFEIFFTRNPNSNLRTSLLLYFQKKGNGQELYLFTPYSALLLATIAIKNYVEGECSLTEQQEINLLAAIFLANNQIDDADAQNGAAINSSNEKDPIKFLIAVHLYKSDSGLHRNVFTQVIKAFKFYDYLEKHPVYSKYLNLFLNKRGYTSWREYLIEITSIYFHGFKNNRFSSIVNVEGTQLNQLISSLSLRVDKISDLELKDHEWKDHKIFRNYPLFIIEQDENHTKFIILIHNYLADKIYQGLLFEIASEIKDETGNKNAYEDLKKVISKEFNEEELFRNLMKEIFPSPPNFTFFGEYKNAEFGDFYLRMENYPNYLFLFEFKDSLLTSKSKQSTTFAGIEDELKKKMVLNEKGDKKGIGQLVSVLQKISKGDASFDQALDEELKKGLIIYPIIVYTDSTYIHDGFNKVMNDMFRQMIPSSENLGFGEIRDLVVMDIDFLIKYKDYFKEGRLDFKLMVGRYFIILSQRMAEYQEIIENTNNISVIGSALQKLFPSFDSAMEQFISKAYKINKPELEMFSTLMKPFLKSD